MTLTVNGLAASYVRRNWWRQKGADVAARLHFWGPQERTKTPRLQIGDVGFEARPGEVVAIIGQSGTGKTTLLRSLVGQLEALKGTISYGGLVLNEDTRERIQNAISVVPQFDLVATPIPLSKYLEYVAAQRMRDTTSEERKESVRRVLMGLDLMSRAEKAVRELSGGERKRAAVAAALLARSSVIFLDEPTTGLDPETEVSLVNMLLDLAEAGGRTVLMISHSPEAIARCHRVLVLGRRRDGSGGVAYFGPPIEMTKYFGGGAIDNVYRVLQDETVDWVSRWMHTPQKHRSGDVASKGESVPEEPNWVSPVHQARIKTRLMLAEVFWDSRYCRSLLWQVAVLTGLILSVMPSNSLTTQGNPIQFLGFIAVAVTFPGLLNATQQIVSEREVLRRDLTVGMSSAAYLASKFLFLAIVGAAQVVVMMYCFGGQGGGASGALLPVRSTETLVILLTTAWATIALGLFVSTIAQAEKTLLLYLPALIIAQILFCGAFLDLSPGFELLGRSIPSSWAFSGLAGSTDLANIEPTCRTAIETYSKPCKAAWGLSAEEVARAASANVGLVGVYLAAAWMGIRLGHRGKF